MKTLSVSDVACRIGVSKATIRNWVKAGHLCALSTGGRLAFAESEILRLKNDLATGRLAKLCRRVNKTHSTSQFIPMEYADCNELIDTVKKLLVLREQLVLPTETLLFLAAMRLLVLAGDVDVPLQHRSSQWIDGLTWHRQCVKCEMRQWHESLSQLPLGNTYTEIAAIIKTANTDDDLGILYQALFCEGEKSQIGSYYTPTKFVSGTLHWAVPRPDKTLLDPCCGTGKYLVTAVRHFALLPENCFGFDLDVTAVRLARVNLFLAAPHREFTPNVFCCDSLLDAVNNNSDTSPDRFGPFDLIATNPPWGACKNTKSPLVAGERFKESFALFLARSLSLLKENGRLSFLLPEAFLRIKTHSDIRKLVLTQTTLHSITLLGRVFGGVFTDVLRLDLVKTKPHCEHACRIVDHNGVESRTQQAVFLKNRHHAFDVGLCPKDREILEKINATRYQTLKGHADWALGIVTGENAKHVARTPDEGFESILRGVDIEKYRTREPVTFVRFEPARYQQSAPSYLYRASEKLVYRFISTKPVFAYDNQGRLTLNSANVLIPRLPGMSVKVVMAFLNSTLFQYVFEKQFATHKVLRGDLEQLPFPLISRELHDAIETQVEMILQQPQESPLYLAALQKSDQFIIAAFPTLTAEDVVWIAKNQ